MTCADFAVLPCERALPIVGSKMEIIRQSPVESPFEHELVEDDAWRIFRVSRIKRDVDVLDPAIVHQAYLRRYHPAIEV